MDKTTKQAHSAKKISDDELSIIAGRVAARELEINGLMSRSLHLAVLIGADLNLVKERLPLGEFMFWVEKNCAFKQHQANRYMRIYRAYPDYVNADKCPVNLSINAALELISAPDDVRELVNEAIAEGEVVHQRTVRELCSKPSYSGNRLTGKPYTSPNVVPFNTVEAVSRPESWVFTNHACKHCMGRVFSRRVSSSVTEFICSECETRVRSQSVESICFCGKELGHPSSGGYGDDVKSTRKSPDKIFECIVNPDRSVVGNRIIVRERPYNPVTAQKQVRSAFTGDSMDYL